MHFLFTFLTLRTFIVFFSTAFSIFIIMLSLNIISVDEAATILHLSPEATNVFKQVISRIQEVTNNILKVLSQLLSKLLSWTGSDVDLSKIKVDVHNTNAGPSSGAN